MEMSGEILEDANKSSPGYAVANVFISNLFLITSLAPLESELVYVRSNIHGRKLRRGEEGPVLAILARERGSR